MEKKIFNCFNLRTKLSIYAFVLAVVFFWLFKIGYEYFSGTLELKDIGLLFSIETFFLIAFLFEYNKKIIITDEGIKVKKLWAKESFFSWGDVKSIGTFKYDNWGKIQPAPKKKGLTNALFISKATFEKLSHTFINKPGQTLKLPFNQELYNLVEQKVHSASETESTHIS